MNSGKNITTAFEVITKTYDSAKKLFDFFEIESDKADFIRLPIGAGKGFLRTPIKSYDPQYWLYREFCLIFQKKSNPFVNKIYKSGGLYVLILTLYSTEAITGYSDQPVVNIARFDIEEAILRDDWTDNISKPDWWFFFRPFWDSAGGNIKWSHNIEGTNRYEGKFTGKVSFDNWWGLTRIRGLTFPLVDLTNDNVEEKIFGGFNLLSNLD
ncbi:MAG: hypothetical protein LBJ61_12220 [Deltaproteobacteria bacterium]|jgi:hypothetical protein|nr:hypothetical protein [Deltaproteobacteria bacterium]